MVAICKAALEGTPGGVEESRLEELVDFFRQARLTCALLKLVLSDRVAIRVPDEGRNWVFTRTDQLRAG